MTKIDFKKTLTQLYAPPSGEFVVVDVPPLQYFMIDGQGDPNSAASYADAVQALYAVAYAVKADSKRRLGRDFVVPPLEGLWWADDISLFTVHLDKSQWRWTMMIMQPEWVTAEMAAAARARAGRKRLAALPLLRLETYYEGAAVQILHIGAYDDEGLVLARLHNEWLPANGYTENGLHHEIYLSDPRRVAPERLKTILRQPVRPL